MQSISLCVLLWGDNVGLQDRCLGPISEALLTCNGLVSDIRIGANELSGRSEDRLRHHVAELSGRLGFPTTVFRSKTNACKYPMMRRMLYSDLPDPDWVMWFDDDSFFRPIPDEAWWQRLSEEMSGHDAIGQQWFMAFQGNQTEFVADQPWFNPEIPDRYVRGRRHFVFLQGSWWVVRYSILKKWNWPIPELRHNGGDTLFGELLRHQRYRVSTFCSKVRINADSSGKHSASPRRGVSETRLGIKYRRGEKLSTAHQNFDVDITRFVDGKEERIGVLSKTECSNSTA